jgi:hypothetical protein
MKKFCRHTLIASILLVCSFGARAGFDEGMAAYAKGEFPIAFNEFKQAAESGDVYAEYNLGVMYGLGQGVRKNEEVAAQWYKKAADKGFAAAQYSLGVAYEEAMGVWRDEAVAFEWYRKAAEQDYPRAQLNLGLMYVRGQSVQPDIVQAYKWFHLAALSGDKLAERNCNHAEKKMTKRQIEQAIELASQWQPKLAKKM